MKRPRTVFLDLDDTIIDDSSTVDGGWSTAVAEHCGSVDAAALEAAITEVRTWYWSDPERHRVGRQDMRGTTVWIVEQALERCGYKDANMALRIAHRYCDMRDQGQCLLPGALEAIEALRDEGIRLALLTNGSQEG